MRISDWSSDVCSSDLRLNPGFLLRLRIFRDRKIMIGDVLEPGLDGERLLGMVRDDRDDVHVALLQRLAAVRGRLSLCADQAAAAKWWLSMPMASVSAEGPMPKALSTRRTSPLMPGCRHQGRACRSEEHTSELQSLMRNSYAVFCLKKKQNTNTTHNHDRTQR